MRSQRKYGSLQLLIHHYLDIPSSFRKEPQRPVTQFSLVSLVVLLWSLLKFKLKKSLLQLLRFVYLSKDLLRRLVEPNEKVNYLEYDELVLIKFLLMHPQLLNLLLNAF